MLYLVQHGISLPEEVDPKKGLSDAGKSETIKMAGFLKAKGVRVDIIWHSNKLRSMQTAQILSEYLKPQEVQERDGINPQDAVDAFPELIEDLGKDLMLVGHLPFLQRLASLLLMGRDTYDLISFKNSAVVCMGYKDTWKIKWICTSELIKEL